MGFSIGKIVRSITKPVKKVLKSPLGKIGLGLAAYKWGPGFLSGKGFGMGDASKWGNLKWLGEGANVNPMRLAALTGLGSLAGSGMVEDWQRVHISRKKTTKLWILTQGKDKSIILERDSIFQNLEMILHYSLVKEAE